MKLKRYNKKLEYSYSFGAYTTLDLLQEKDFCVLKVVLKKEGLGGKEVEKVKKICEKKNIECSVDDRIIEKISFKENTYVVGVFKKYVSSVDNGNQLVLVNPSSTGNIGTIMRTMVAFDFKNLVVIKPAVDVFNPKAIRSSMGSFFKINFEFFNSFEEYLKKFKNRNIYSFMLNGNIVLNDFKCNSSNISLVFGNESKGLEEKFKKYGESIYIPHSKKTDSLNLPVSVGIVLYSLKDCG